MLQEKDDIIKHKVRWRAEAKEPTLPPSLTVEELYNKVSRHSKITIRSPNRSAHHKSSTHRISSLQPTDHSLGDYLLEEGNWDDKVLESVSQIGPDRQMDTTNSTLGICALSGGKA